MNTYCCNCKYFTGSADSSASDFVPTKLRRETTMLRKLPTIPQGKVPEGMQQSFLYHDFAF